jgi:hypothetical protein
LKKLSFFVKAATGASSNFGIEKLHILGDLDTPNIPSAHEQCFLGKYFEQLSPKVEKS